MKRTLALRLDTMNPIFAREFRSRWRRPLSYVIVLGYSLVWSVLAWQFYSIQQAAGGASVVMVRSVLPGHQLFMQTSWIQMILWALIAPMLTAPSITSERQLNMLNELLFTPITARDLVRGKFSSAVFFVGVMLVVPLPITALCFQMGGVSPAEFVQAFILQTVVAVSGVAVGIMCSSWAKKTSSAMGAAFTLGAVGSGLLTKAMISAPGFNLFKVLILAVILAAVAFFCLRRAEEAVEVSMMEEDRWEPEMTGQTEEELEVASAGVALLPEVFSPVQQVVAESWLEAQRVALQASNGHKAEMPAAEPIAAPSRIHRNDPSIKGHPIAAMEEVPVLEDAEHGDFPIEILEVEPPNAPFGWMRRWIESNPLLQREWRVRWRTASNPGLDMKGVGESDLQFLCSPSMLKVWLFGGCVMAIVARGIPVQAWWTATLMVLLGCGAFCSIVASMTFIRERDQGMLSMLLLTRLTPREIVWGKLSIPLALAAFYFTPIAAILFVWGMGYHPGIAIGGLAIMLSTYWCAAACGVFFSWLCRHTVLATMASLAITTLSLILTVPITLPGAPRLQIGADWIFSGPLWSNSALSGFGFMGIAFGQALLMFGLGTALLWVVKRSIRPDVLDKESRSILHTDLSRNLTSGNLAPGASK